MNGREIQGTGGEHSSSTVDSPLHIEGKANTNIIVNLFDKRLDNKSLFYINMLL